MAITIKNDRRRPLKLDITIPIEMRTIRPPLSDDIERLEQGDLLIIKTGADLQITITEDTLSIR